MNSTLLHFFCRLCTITFFGRQGFVLVQNKKMENSRSLSYYFKYGAVIGADILDGAVVSYALA